VHNHPSKQKIVLASASTIRFEMMRNAGINFTASPSNVDEASVKASFLKEGKGASQLVKRLAIDKALAVNADSDTLVIGADQVLEFGGQIFDKPNTVADIKERLLLLEGQEHRLIGAVCIVQKGKENWQHLSVNRLTMRKFSDGFLNDYLHKEGSNVRSCVGGYRFEAFGVQLFEKIEGDFFSILGLSLLPLLAELRRRGAVLS